MVQFYGKVLTDQYGYDPYKTHIFPAAFVDDGYAQQQYYATLISQAAFIYANAAHLNFTVGKQHYTANPGSIVNLVTTAQADIASWNAQFSDGPNGDGTPSWVSQGKNQGIGALPADQGIGVAPIVNGYATLTSLTRTLPDGTQSLYAWYGGDGNYNGAGSNPVAVTVGSASASHHQPATHHRPAKH